MATLIAPMMESHPNKLNQIPYRLSLERVILHNIIRSKRYTTNRVVSRGKGTLKGRRVLVRNFSKATSRPNRNVVNSLAPILATMLESLTTRVIRLIGGVLRFFIGIIRNTSLLIFMDL